MRYALLLLLSGFLSALPLQAQEKFRNDNAMDAPEPVTAEQFNKITSNMEKPVLVVFTAQWCRICKEYKPVIRQVARDFNGKFVLLMVDVDDSREVSDLFKIDALPATALYNHGQIVWDRSGMVTRQDLNDAISLYTDR